MTAPPDLSPSTLLRAYSRGAFPMAETRNSSHVFWVVPENRGIVPLDKFHISRSLRRRILTWDYTIRTNTDFEGVVRGCADRNETRINAAIFKAYQRLFEEGHAHSLEVWEKDELVGGVYGVSLGGAFFGESMFSRRTDASKVALAYLVDRLRQGGFRLFDTQFLTAHLASLGAVEIPQSAYRTLLKDALGHIADFTRPEVPQPSGMLQRMSQTS
jgi:leucyl/phenylalanyl-tRNA--protein transferase